MTIIEQSIHIQNAQRPSCLQHETYKVKVIFTVLFFNALIFNFNVNYTIEPFFRGSQFILLTERALHSEQKFSQYFVSTALFSARSLRQDSLHIIQSLLRR